MTATDPAIEKIIDLKNKGSSICFVSGNFNIIHPGHLRFLLFAAEQADQLVVGLYDEHHSIGAYFSNEERLQALQTMNFVTEVIIVKDDICDIINTIKPDVVVKGKEFEKENNVEADILHQTGGKLIFSSGEKLFSSRDLLQKKLRESNGLREKLHSYLVRHKVTSDVLSQTLEGFKSKNIAVFGDIIMDEYQECLPIGMSQEDPTIVVSPIDSFLYLGGAGIVAAHARNLGASTSLFSILGSDEKGEKAREALARYGVDTQIEYDDSRPTTHKLRYRAKEKTLLRVNHYRKHDIRQELVEKLVKRFAQCAANIDLVVFSDFSYGVLCPDFIQQVSTCCHKHNIPVVADSQTSSQIGDLTKFSHLLLTTPTELEARLTTKDENSGLIQVSTNLGQSLNAKHVIVTLGAEGALIRSHNDKTASWDTEQLPALADNVVDIAGAGDALFVTTSLALISGANIWQSAFIGSAAAAIQVSKRGNVPIAVSELSNNLQKLV